MAGIEKNKKLRLVFMGTPDFAVCSLAYLVNAGYDIAAVVTAPDKPAGRGMELRPSAVKEFAVSRGLNILQPEKLKDPQFLNTLRELQADLFVVVAFRMLPEVVWNMPPMGTINVHASLLPQYRGAAPINWAIIRGETETGVTTFKLKHEIDTGNILLQSRIPIRDEDNAGSIHDALMEEGAKLLVETLRQLEAGELKEVPQPESGSQPLHHAPKIHTETCRIDWTKDVMSIHNLIRGLSPYPAAFTLLDNKKLKIFSSTPVRNMPSAAPGTVSTDSRSYLRYAAQDGWIEVNELQWEGKKRMMTEDFLRGYRPS